MLKVSGCVQYAATDAAGGFVETIPAKPARDQRIVMRPNGPEVIADWIVAALFAGKSTNARAVNMSSSIKRCIVRRAFSASAMPDQRAWSGFEDTTAQGCLSACKAGE